MFPQSEAQELTIVKMSKFGGGIGAPSKEERLKGAAEIHLRLGQIQRYCELMVELGEVWQRTTVHSSLSCLIKQTARFSIEKFTEHFMCIYGYFLHLSVGDMKYCFIIG